MKILVTSALLCGSLCPLHAASAVNQWSFAVGSTVPDNSGIGLTDRQEISTPLAYLTSVTVHLSMTGGWSGDMYAYIAHASGFSVLLNRPGRTASNSAGSGVTELMISLTDDSLADIHTALPASGSAAGFFQPDARSIDPDYALDSSPRTAFLASFNGLDPNGEWTLFVADLSGGDEMVLNGWGLSLQGVPEPSVALLAALGGCMLLRRRR